MNIWSVIKTLTVTFLVSLFAGLIIFSIGFGAMFPVVHFPGLWLAEREFATDVNLLTQNYSYKPGQSGTTLNYFFTNPEGKERDVTLRVITYSGLAYAILFDILALLAATVKKLFPGDSTANFLQTWSTYAFSIAIFISFGSMAVLVIWSLATVALALIGAW
jgi:hypothetical protein